MAQYNPYKGSFEQSKGFNKYAQIALWISTGMIVIAFFLKAYNPNWSSISDLISNINCFFIISFATLTFISEVIFYQASVQRSLYKGYIVP